MPMTAPAVEVGDAGAVEVAAPAGKFFAPEETRMVRRVLALVNRPARTIVTPRGPVSSPKRTTTRWIRLLWRVNTKRTRRRAWVGRCGRGGEALASDVDFHVCSF